jgi:hypothetical protein
MAYGLRPVNFGSGGYSSGGFTEYPIVSSTDGATGGETDDMYTGCFMLLEPSGYVTALALTPTGATAALSTVGVAVGFRYINADGEPVWSQKYTGNAANQEAYAYVADDPTQHFIVLASGATVQADMGLNANVVSSSGTGTAIAQGTTATGLSTNVLDTSSQDVTAALSLRLISIPKDGTNENSSTPNVIVKINPDVHQLLSGLGA